MRAKKNVTLEVRLPDATKAAFMAQCRRQDRTASDAVRAFINAQLEAGEQPLRRPSRRSVRLAVTAWVAGAAIGAGLATPSLARSAPWEAQAFAALDRNHDGVLSPSEFAAR
ncbi:EF-hand domain-containing protein [Sphingomonas floccifaciens]|uniref:EF-hand domain-containing protein n=1 Tax=Sphingomonas floccifaciens TaxID=1844115 RepID=A0ABW4NIP4_9SPHN